MHFKATFAYNLFINCEGYWLGINLILWCASSKLLMILAYAHHAICCSIMI